MLRRISSCPHAVVDTPAGPREGVARHVAWWQPSPFSRRVGPCVACFEACSTFTARYGLLARGVAERPFPPKASTVSLPPRSLRLLPVGATSCRVGVAPTEDPRLCTAHAKSYAVEPAGHRPVFADGVSFAKEHEKRGLEGIVNILFMAEQTPAQASHHRPVPLHEGSQGGSILTFDKAFEQLAVVLPAGLSLRCHCADVRMTASRGLFAMPLLLPAPRCRSIVPQRG